MDLCMLRTTERLGCVQYRQPVPFDCATPRSLVEALRDRTLARPGRGRRAELVASLSAHAIHAARRSLAGRGDLRITCRVTIRGRERSGAPTMFVGAPLVCCCVCVF